MKLVPGAVALLSLRRRLRSLRKAELSLTSFALCAGLMRSWLCGGDSVGYSGSDQVCPKAGRRAFRSISIEKRAGRRLPLRSAWSSRWRSTPDSPQRPRRERAGSEDLANRWEARAHRKLVERFDQAPARLAGTPRLPTTVRPNSGTTTGARQRKREAGQDLTATASVVPDTTFFPGTECILAALARASEPRSEFDEHACRADSHAAPDPRRATLAALYDVYIYIYIYIYIYMRILTLYIYCIYIYIYIYSSSAPSLPSLANPGSLPSLPGAALDALDRGGRIQYDVVGARRLMRLRHDLATNMIRTW